MVTSLFNRSRMGIVIGLLAVLLTQMPELASANPPEWTECTYNCASASPVVYTYDGWVACPDMSAYGWVFCHREDSATTFSFSLKVSPFSVNVVPCPVASVSRYVTPSFTIEHS